MNDNEKKADHLIDQVRTVRNRLVQKYGGLHGWVNYLQKMQPQKSSGKFARPKQTSMKRRG